MEYDIELLIAQLSFKVRLARDAIQEEKTKDISERDETILEYLEYLEDSTTEGEVTFSNLNNFFKKISRGTVSRALQRLYLKGYVERIESPKDRRSKILHITDEGRIFLAKERENKRHLYGLIVTHLKLKPKEAKMLDEIIPRAINNFDEWLGLAKPSARGKASG